MQRSSMLHAKKLLYTDLGIMLLFMVPHRWYQTGRSGR